MTNPIDSLPATPETVGMPQIGDVARCCKCGHLTAVIAATYLAPIFCYWCDSYDVEKVKP